MLRPGTLRYQGWPGCPALTDTSYYEIHAKQADQNYRRYERDSEINKRYGAAWRKIRAAYVAPPSARCVSQILGVVATPFTMLTTHQNAPEAYPSLTSYAADH